MLRSLAANKPAQRQQCYQRRHTGNRQPANPGAFSNSGGWRHCVGSNGLRLYLLELRQLGLQFGQLFFLVGDQLILALKLLVELIDSGLQLMVLQGAGGQLFDSGINHGDVRFWHRLCHG
ncbi:hypothetical protein D3C81_1656090 [compost metagenome]